MSALAALQCWPSSEFMQALQAQVDARASWDHAVAAAVALVEARIGQQQRLDGHLRNAETLSILERLRGDIALLRLADNTPEPMEEP